MAYTPSSLVGRRRTVQNFRKVFAGESDIFILVLVLVGGVVISSLPSLLPFPTHTHHLKISNRLIICFATESWSLFLSQGPGGRREIYKSL